MAGKLFLNLYESSADNWVVNGCPHTGPTTTQNKIGMHFAWYTMGGGEGVFYCNSKNLSKTFSKRDSVSSNPSAKHPQIVSLINGNIIIVWDETVKKGDKNNAWIGLQERDPEGTIIASKFISSDDAISEFAVVKPIDENNLLVAYKKRHNGKTNIAYKIVSLINE